jgi:hypothetical protein
LGSNWNSCAHLVKSKSSHEKDQKINQQTFCNGSDNIDVLEHLE